MDRDGGAGREGRRRQRAVRSLMEAMPVYLTHP